jgi:hypothetical protein
LRDHAEFRDLLVSAAPLSLPPMMSSHLDTPVRPSSRDSVTRSSGMTQRGGVAATPVPHIQLKSRKSESAGGQLGVWMWFVLILVAVASAVGAFFAFKR